MLTRYGDLMRSSLSIFRSVDAVSARGLLKIGTRVRVNLTRKDQNRMALDVVRVAKPQTGIGLEFQEVDADSNKTFWPGSGVFADCAETSVMPGRVCTT